MFLDFYHFNSTNMFVFCGNIHIIQKIKIYFFVKMTFLRYKQIYKIQDLCFWPPMRGAAPPSIPRAYHRFAATLFTNYAKKSQF